MNAYHEYMKSIDLKNKICARFGDESSEYARACDNSDVWESQWYEDLDYKIPRLPSKDVLLAQLEKQEALLKEVAFQ